MVIKYKHLYLALCSGFECEEHNNPCDFYLDILTGDAPMSPHKPDQANALNGNGK